MAKTLAEFHFDTSKSGLILQSFLNDAHISLKATENLLGYSYDTIIDTLRGHNKDSKLEFVVKVCTITNRTIQEWCERMLEGVNEELAAQIRATFGMQPSPCETKPDLEAMVVRWLDAQSRSIDQYKATHEEMRKQYETQIERMAACFADERSAYQAELDRLHAQNSQLCDIIATMTKER